MDGKMIDAASGGALFNKTPTEACNLISITSNTQQFGTRYDDPPRRSNEGFFGQQQRRYDPFSNTYNSRWKDHPKLSYGAQAQNFQKPQYRPLVPPPPPNPKQAMNISKLDFPVALSQRTTHKNSSSLLSLKSRALYCSKRLLIPRRISGIRISKHNAFSVFSSLVDNFSVDGAEASECPPPHEIITSSSLYPTSHGKGDIIVESSLFCNSFQKILSGIEVPGFVRYCTWKWRGYSIRYQYSGTSGPALVLVHGFGANSDHWRKNLPVLAQSHRVYAIDLIGYGYSDKPNPRELQVKSFYTFETWASQLNDFCMEIVRDEAFFICNSIGGLVGLQAAVMEPAICKGIMLLNISLRMLHIKKQPWYGRPLIKSFQSLLRNTALGKFFFRTVATPESVRNILCQCYHDTSQVTDELVKIILDPGLDPGAADCPVLVAWGDKDPWEPIELGKAYAQFDTVEDFVVLPNVGHCPQDEAPHLVNPVITSFVARHAPATAALSPQLPEHSSPVSLLFGILCSIWFYLSCSGAE
ncbi:UNVERIFIED_CONTAM: putative aminoacrylate hydrolase RutD [Sesamum latifolium]|uniref:Aminoacrylate hydrolase RutD n=1 Tax=Sesamum latifolium TaxID=2727402 RepID=A0AAW2XD84_9LAMI